MRAPKKYADKDRTVVTKEWLAWKADQDILKEDKVREVLAFNDDPARYWPEEYDKGIGDGAWIFVIEVPPVRLANDWQVPLLSLWFATPHTVRALAGMRAHQAVIQTPGGTLHLWPHEYTPCHDPKGLLGLDGVQMHSLGGQPVLDEEQVFYLTSRGIPPEEATMMLFDQIVEPNFIYVTFPEYAVEMFAGVGTSMRSGVREHYFEGRSA